MTRGHRSWVAGLAGLVLLAGACSQSPAAVTKAATTGAFTGKSAALAWPMVRPCATSAAAW